MTLVFDILHFFAAALLAVIGIDYEREEECDPVHYEPAAYVFQTTDGSSRQVFVTTEARFIEASECDSGSSSVIYPVL